MSGDQKFEEMIQAGWEVAARNFHENAILKWRKQAGSFLTEMLGPDHPYTLNLVDQTSKTGAIRILSGIGVLCAAKESMFHGRLQSAVL